MPGLDALTAGVGQTDQRDARHAVGGLLAVQGPTALDIRTGVLAAPGSTALITGTTKTGPRMSVLIGVHVAVTSRGTANGPYLGPTLEAPLEVDVDLAPASGSRIDVVYVKQRDMTSGIPTPDASPGPLYGVLPGQVSTGVPAKPDLSTIVGAEELGTVTVVAGATSTNGAGVTIANTARQTGLRGAILPVRASDTDPGVFVGQYRDHPTRGLQRWTGTAWQDYPAVSVPYFSGGLGSSTAYTLALDDIGTVLSNNNTTGPTIVTVPTTAAVPFPTGSWVDVARYTPNGLTVAAASGVNITWRGQNLGTAGFPLHRYQVVRLHKVATSTWFAYDLSGGPDTDWANLAPASGWAVGSDGARYKLKGGMCTFQVHMTRAAWTGALTAATFPDGFRPPYPHWYTNAFASAGLEIKIFPTGVMTATGNNSVTGIVVSGQFPTD